MATRSIEELDAAVRNFYEGHGSPEVLLILLQPVVFG